MLVSFFDKNMKLDLYQYFGLDPTCTTQEIKQKFKKLALKYHPDKQSQDTNKSDSEFHKLYTYYQVLIDPKKRSTYDKTGEICETGFSDIEYTKVTTQDIDEFVKLYKYSDEEKLDLYDAYTKSKGSFEQILERVPLSTTDDLERFKLVLDQGIKTGELQQFKLFKLDEKIIKKLVKKEQKEKQQLEKLQEAMQKQHQVSKKSSVFQDTVEKLAAEQDMQGDIDDAEFEKLQQKLFGKNAKSTKNDDPTTKKDKNAKKSKERAQTKAKSTNPVQTSINSTSGKENKSKKSKADMTGEPDAAVDSNLNANHKSRMLKRKAKNVATGPESKKASK